MALPYVEIEEVLQQWVVNDPPIIDFTANNVLIATGLDRQQYADVFNYLLSRSPYILIPKKILFCPNNHKSESFSIDEYVEEDEVFTCHNCGVEHQADLSRMFVVFSFNEDYREQVKKKTEKVA